MIRLIIGNTQWYLTSSFGCWINSLDPLSPLGWNSSISSLIVKKTHSRRPLIMLEKKRKKKTTNAELVSNRSGSCWQHDIPQDIMETILHKLSIGDRVRMQAVCKSWRANILEIAPAAAALYEEAPWLMLPYKPWSKSMSFYSLSEDRIYNFEMPKFCGGGRRGGWCCGACKGWLVMVAGAGYDLHMFLLSPISGATIKLPPLKSIPSFQNWLQRSRQNKCANVSNFFSRVEILLSANNSSDGIVVAAVFRGGDPDEDDDSEGLAFCRPPDSGWTIFVGDRPRYCHYGDILFHKDKLYALVYKWKEAGEESKEVIETCTICFTDDFTLPLGLIIRCVEMRGGGDDDYDDYEEKEVLVESTGGKLLLVRRIIDLFLADSHPDDPELDVGYSRTRKFVINNVANDNNTLKSLGDQALFVGSSGSFSLPTMTNHSSICSNCIYFALHQYSVYSNDVTDMVSRESGIFNLADGKVKRCFPSVKLPMPSKCGWFTPKVLTWSSLQNRSS